jgi:CNT family concentrative nucleoside transporter
MVEAPLLVRPYLKDLSRGELFMVMTGGMATIAGSVFVLYATLLAPVLAGAAGHLLAASLINAPGAILMAALLVPPGDGRTAGGEVRADDEAESTMGALARGTADGVALLINIAAMLIVLVACVSLVNQLLALLPTGGPPISLQRLLGWPMAPVAWLLGVPWSEAATAGSLLATKTVLNELIAYADLAALPADALSPRSRLILVYALCGFANFGSLGIMIGGLGTMLPERRAEIAGLGLRAILSGTFATCLGGAIVGVVA